MLELSAPESIMFVDYILKGLLILLLAVFADHIFNKASASQRHLIWIIALTALLVLPAVSSVMPQLNLSLLTFPFLQETSLDSAALTADELNANVSQFFDLTPAGIISMGFIIYLIGTISVFVWQLIGRFYANKVRREATVIENLTLKELFASIRKDFNLRENVVLLESHLISSPFSIGLLNPAIILPMGAGTWPHSILKSVLTHEIAHIKRKDLLFRGIAQIACCINWINPLTWLGLRKLFIEQEIACDNYVLSTGSKPSDYAQSLLAVANVRGGKLDFAMAAIGRQEELKDRLLEILKPRRSKDTLKGGRYLAFLFLALMLLLPVFFLNIWTGESTLQAFNKAEIFAPLKNKAEDEKSRIKEKKEKERLKKIENEKKSTASKDEKIKADPDKKIKEMKAKGVPEEKIKALLLEAQKKMSSSKDQPKDIKKESEQKKKDSEAIKKAESEKKKKESKSKEVKDKEASKKEKK